MSTYGLSPVAAQIKTQSSYGPIVGESPEFKRVLQWVETVAMTDASVLLLGETGTGKELIAQAIHERSRRNGRNLVKLNCAAIPTDLLESELFGHERGAFTGAVAQKSGRCELADKGTLFLDEVGDIPLALQPKLLRVLQEREFERLGSSRTHKVDFRLIAATNCDLHRMVACGEFRSDLYYRLDVFPIVLPALRERREDIPALVQHFAKVFSQRMNKTIDHIPGETIAAFQSYTWPGNIRELQNVMERAVILAKDGVLPNPLERTASRPVALNFQGSHMVRSSMTLEESERSFILEKLEQVNWIVGGPSGAAAKLGLKRTTLNNKMKKLGILRPIRVSPEIERGARADKPPAANLQSQMFSALRASTV